VVIDLGDVRLRHAWAHGDAGGTPIDVELEDLKARARIAPKGIDASLERLGIVARAPVPREARLSVTGQGSVPSEKPLAADARIGGTVGRMIVNAEGAIDDKDVRIVADVPNADALPDLFPGAPIHARASAHADVTGKLPHLAPHVHATLGDATADVDGD